MIHCPNNLLAQSSLFKVDRRILPLWMEYAQSHFKLYAIKGHSNLRNAHSDLKQANSPQHFHDHIQLTNRRNLQKPALLVAPLSLLKRNHLLAPLTPHLHLLKSLVSFTYEMTTTLTVALMPQFNYYDELSASKA